MRSRQGANPQCALANHRTWTGGSGAVWATHATHHSQSPHCTMGMKWLLPPVNCRPLVTRLKSTAGSKPNLQPETVPGQVAKNSRSVFPCFRSGSMTRRRMRARKSKVLRLKLWGRSSSACARAAFAKPGSRRTEPLCVSAVRRRSLAQRDAELLAGGTRKRGSPAAIAITAPFPGALLTGLVAALGPACPFGSLCSRSPGAISLEAMRPAHAWSGLRPWVDQRNSMNTRWKAGCVADFAFSRVEARVRVSRGFAVTGYRLRERLAAPVAEIRDVQKSSSGAHR
ncbi:hypothetical protein ABIC01_005747 [Bradyrhizobium sp. RT4b]